MAPTLPPNGRRTDSDGTASVRFRFISIDGQINKVGDEGIEALVRLLKNSRLVALDLSANSIRANGASALATVLTQMPSLQSIELGSNHV